MKRKLAITLGSLAIIASVYLFAADHIDAPGVASTSSDITDFYAFQSMDNTSNIVFVANLQGLLSPTATASASFDENVMVEFNIDTNADAIEDLVIQCTFENGQVSVYGPVAPTQMGTSSTLVAESLSVSAAITAYNQSAVIGTGNGIKVFAGPRDDPFFMDFAQYGQIIGGNATSFNDPGADTFAGSNVMSVVVEVPKSMIGGSGSINTWVTSNRKQ
ncbi:MAG: molecular chaperone DnaK [Cytophagales bacterium CG12_big_fil_rev_8_21_14_0_65_40_12]|nr:MAG: molecular chaperone DnaK [Cytophagales bacterium CG12_big_fil_rev_8_21_14_0_65_40_12]PIW04843.1 MAG: molecular chaperone DnaK [Cytophagales bacterium CG17_big_fil_post_rev_8_21_14_2_50_40_13]